MSKALDIEEEEYVQAALQAGVQSTEILNVLVIGRCVQYCLRNLVNAMENETHTVFDLGPKTIQQLYTEMKVGIKQTYLSSQNLPGKVNIIGENNKS